MNGMNPSMNELETKLSRIRELLEQRKADMLLIRRSDNFAWATCGAASFVNQATDHGVAALLVTRSRQHLITDNIEAPRLEQEEQLVQQGWEFHVTPWHEARDRINDLRDGLTLAADGVYPDALDLSAELIPLRAALTIEETARFREIGAACGKAMDSAIRSVRPGMSEHEIAGQLAHEAWKLDLQPIVVLVAADVRIFRYRHPLPTALKLKQYAMLVLCGRRGGLIGSVTRLVHFGKLSVELQRKSECTANIDAQFILATRPERSLKEIIQVGINAYRETGYPEEWKLHHQGGLAAYAPREIIATPETDYHVLHGQAYAWNPSITGTKSEDTIIVGEKSNEIITAIPGWPTIEIHGNGEVIHRPAILELT
jgi:antitoxin VapB